MKRAALFLILVLVATLAAAEPCRKPPPTICKYISTPYVCKR